MTTAGKVTKKDQPLYQMLVNTLRTEILNGEYAVGAPLPSELTLVERFGVSRHTVREALRHLRDLGLVESRQGVGTLVRESAGPQVYVHQVNSISDLHDYKVRSIYERTGERVTPDEALAARLGAKTGESWLRIDGIRVDQRTEEAICAVEIFIPPEFAGIGRLLGKLSGPIYDLIEAVNGETIEEVDQEVRALTVPPQIRERLKADPSDIVVEIKRIYRLRDGRVAEISFNYYRADKFSLAMNLRRLQLPR